MAYKKTLDSDVVTPQSPESILGLDPYEAQAVEIEVVPAPKGGAGDKKQFDELAFNEEMVEVMVHESTDANAENPIYTACNGVNQYFFRGEAQWVRRKYVAILASVKEQAISTPEYTTPDGSRSTKIVRRSSLKYPFSIITDKNPRGAAWLKSLLASPT